MICMGDPEQETSIREQMFKTLSIFPEIKFELFRDIETAFGCSRLMFFQEGKPILETLRELAKQVEFLFKQFKNEEVPDEIRIRALARAFVLFYVLTVGLETVETQAKTEKEECENGNSVSK